jgi:hypothetical protein
MVGGPQPPTPFCGLPSEVPVSSSYVFTYADKVQIFLGLLGPHIRPMSLPLKNSLLP